MPKIVYTCNCPDATRQRPGKIFTRGFSSSLPSNWSGGQEIPSRAVEGRDGITVRGFNICKHVRAVMMKESEMGTSPTDFPLRSPSRKLLPTTEGFAGFDDFQE
jgi:hypothetical protein